MARGRTVRKNTRCRKSLSISNPVSAGIIPEPPRQWASCQCRRLRASQPQIHPAKSHPEHNPQCTEPAAKNRNNRSGECSKTCGHLPFRDRSRVDVPSSRKQDFHAPFVSEGRGGVKPSLFEDSERDEYLPFVLRGRRTGCKWEPPGRTLPLPGLIVDACLPVSRTRELYFAVMRQTIDD